MSAISSKSKSNSTNFFFAKKIWKKNEKKSPKLSFVWRETGREKAVFQWVWRLKKNFFDFATTPVLFIFKKFEQKFEKNPQLTFTHSFLNSLIFPIFSLLFHPKIQAQNSNSYLFNSDKKPNSFDSRWKSGEIQAQKWRISTLW